MKKRKRYRWILGLVLGLLALLPAAAVSAEGWKPAESAAVSYARKQNGYRITYDGNKGKVPAKSKIVYQGKKYGKLATPTRKGYTFTGWYTKRSGGSKVTASTKVKKKSSHVLYAHWKKKKYTITYQLNGGKNHPKNPSKYDVTTAAIILKKPSRNGYTFMGWYSDSKCKNKVTKIQKGSAGNKKLYAKWSANAYRIRYYGNGADSGTMADTICKYGSSHKLSTNGFKRKGYLFAGWAATGKGKVIFQDKAKIKNLAVKGVKTLYAQWKKEDYAIAYFLNGGTNHPNNPSAYQITTNTITLKDPTKTGCTFAGWYADSGFKTKVTKIAKGSTGAKKLYAKWEVNTKINTYTIRYHGNGATGGAMNDSVSCKYGSPYVLPPNAYEKAWYTFTGWSTSPEGNIVYQDKASVTFSSGADQEVKHLYAQWTANTYDIRYHGNGATGGKMEDHLSCKYYVTYWLSTNAFERTGYTFAGWSTTPDGDVVYQNEGRVKNPVNLENGTMDLYAQWTPITYHIYYQLNGGTNHSKNPAQYTTESNTILLSEPYREKYIFAGWYKDVYYTPITQIPQGSRGDMHIYAKWELKMPEQIRLSASECNLLEGTSQTLTAEVLPEDAGDRSIRWYSSGRAANVDQQGTVTAVTEGTAVITARTANGLEAKCTVNVEMDPVMIDTPEALMGINNQLDGHYMLANDIDLSGYDWRPIGPDRTTPFTGIFDGAGHTITGMNITDSSLVYAGLFGYHSGEIRNLTVSGKICTEEPNGDMYKYVGGICACSERGRISSCISKVDISSVNYNTSQGTYTYVGGIAGELNMDSIVSGCRNYGTVSGASTAGTRTDVYAGGIAGWCINGSKIENCENSGTISSYSETEITKYFLMSCAGGIAGDIGASGAAVLGCSNSGSVKAEMYPAGETTYPSIAAAGGLVGWTLDGAKKVEGVNTSANILALTNEYARAYMDHLLGGSPD